MTNELLTKLGEALVTGDLTNQQLFQETKKPGTSNITERECYQDRRSKLY